MHRNRFRGETHAAAEEGPWPRGQVEFFQYQQEVEGHAVRPLYRRLGVVQVLTLKPAFKIPVLEFLGQVRSFQGDAVFPQLLQGLFPEMINQMRDETVQFQEEQLVLQEGAALKTSADVLLVGIEQQKAERRPDHHHDQNQETGLGVS